METGETEQVTVGSEDGVMVYVFPNGIQAFAQKYSAEVLQLEWDSILYYAAGKWTALGESPDHGSTPSTLVSLHKPKQ